MSKANIRATVQALANCLQGKTRVKGGDAEQAKWVTLSNGAVVQLGENGEVKKGLGNMAKGQNIKEAAKSLSQEVKPHNPGAKQPAHVAQRHGAEAKTPSGHSKSELEPRDRAALSNAGKFTSKKNAESRRDGQKYRTNILQGENGQFWVPATNREESILTRLGYKQAK